MAGVSLAWHLAPRLKVLLLEQESQPGYHSTGRSAATLHRSYGNRAIRALTAASAPFYLDPPDGFAETPLWRQSAVLKVAREDQREELAQNLDNTRRFVPDAQPLDRAGCLRLLPALYEVYNPMPYEAAKEMEVELAIGLREPHFDSIVRARGPWFKATPNLLPHKGKFYVG